MKPLLRLAWSALVIFLVLRYVPAPWCWVWVGLIVAAWVGVFIMALVAARLMRIGSLR